MISILRVRAESRWGGGLSGKPGQADPPISRWYLRVMAYTYLSPVGYSALLPAGNAPPGGLLQNYLLKVINGEKFKNSESNGY